MKGAGTGGYSNIQIIMLIIGNTVVIVGVNIFFLLSGWCRIHFKWRKIIELIIKVYIIFGIIQTIGLLTGRVEFNIESVKQLLEESVKQLLDPLDLYWFIMTYIFLSFVSKYLNTIIDSWNCAEFLKYIIGFVIICCIYGFWIDVNLDIMKGYSFLMSICLNLLGGGLKRFYSELKVNTISTRILLFIYLFCIFVNSTLIYFFYKRGNVKAWDFYAYNNVLVVFESVLIIFLITRQVGKRNKILEYLAKTTITVYLIPSTCWLTMFRKAGILLLQEFLGYYIAYLFLPIYALGIYLLASTVDFCYEKLIGRYICKIYKAVENCVSTIFFKG